MRCIPTSLFSSNRVSMKMCRDASHLLLSLLNWLVAFPPNHNMTTDNLPYSALGMFGGHAEVGVTVTTC